MNELRVPGALATWITVAAIALTITAFPSAAGAAHHHRDHDHGHRHHRTWYVRAAARPRTRRANGSRRAPFRSLAAAERASRPGDTIVILPSPLSTPPLDGGIALKRRQTLRGAGPRVLGGHARTALPRIANTSASSHHGDAVELANGATVRNLVIGPTTRGGIYGADVRHVTIADNDVSATNSSCTTGFVVQPFTLPTLAPGVGVPFGSGLPNGWAAIMIDESRTASNVAITGNYVHDGSCADGIDVRASGTARVAANVARNTLTRLHQGASQQSVLAVGMQTTGTARLTAHVTHNAETYIGNATVGDFGNADSEGLFANSAGRSRLIERADHNTFAHGLGHLSANCFEAAASNGGPTMHLVLRDSTCDYVVGDILEADNLSRDSTMTFLVDHVRAAHSTFVGSEPFHQVEPGDDGDCMLEVASGAASSTSVTISDSQLTDCVADGVGVVSNVVDGAGKPVRSLRFDIDRSRITDNRQSNLRVANATPIDDLAGRVQRSDLSRSAGTLIALENLDSTGATHARLDLGGGSLGSLGQNCISGGSPLDVELVRYNAAAEHDWWGSPGGPGSGSVFAAGGSLDTSKPLARPPAGTC